jgi:transposase
MSRKPYPSDVTDDEWNFVCPYLALIDPESPQRVYDLRTVFNALRWIVRAGAPWRYLPTNFPPWEAVYQQSQRWVKAGVFEAMVHDLRELLRVLEGKGPEPTAAIIDSRTLQSTPESGHRAGYDGAKKKKGSKIHMIVDTLGHLLTLRATPANQQDRDQVDILSEQVREVTGNAVNLVYADQGYTGEDAQADARQHGIELQVVKLPSAKRGFVLLPRRWVVERSFAWLARFRRLARDYERLPRTLEGLHMMVFASVMLGKMINLLCGSS